LEYELVGAMVYWMAVMMAVMMAGKWGARTAD
jgi:hypothetical protein